MGVCASKQTSNDVPNTSPRAAKIKIESDTMLHIPGLYLEDTTKPLKILIKSQKRPLPIDPTSTACYSCSPGRTKGTALILNNSGVESKKGAEVDVKNLQLLFKAIKFKAKVVNNLKAKEIEKSVEAFAKNCKAKETDVCFIVIIGGVKCTGDGNKLAEIGGVDGKFVPTSQIIEFFSDERCPQLKGRPKVFLFHGHFYDVGGVLPDYGVKLAFKDIFVANAILQGKLQKQTIASYYIQALCKVFMNEVFEKDLEAMIQQVEQMVYNHDRSTQHTHYDNLYFKKCYLQSS